MELEHDILAIWTAPGLDTGHKAVLTVVRYHADESGVCRVTIDRIEAMTGLGRRTVLRRMADLVALQIVGRVSDKRCGNSYTLALSSATVTPQKGHTDTSVVSQGHLSSATQAPQKGHTDTSGLIDVLCGLDVATEQQTTEQQANAVCAPTRETVPLPGEARELVEAWWKTQTASGGRAPGMFPPPAVAQAVVDLIVAHGAGRVRWAIGAALEKTNRGAPSLGFLRKLVEEGERQGTSNSTTTNKRAHTSAGIWAQHGVEVPRMKSGRMDEA